MRSLILVLLFWFLSTPAWAQKANPYLKLLKRTERLKAAFEHISPLIPALVQTSDPRATAEAVRRSGGHAGRPVGSVLPVRASLETLDALTRRDEVVRVEASPPKRPVLDLSRPDVRADLVEAGTDLPYPFDGRGVIAAMVDTGIDYEHPSFGKRTRVQKIWDQAFATGEPPPGQDSGALCDREDILRGLAGCDSIDIVGHGTHVMDTMAGSGDKYRGMAPRADIMAVASIDFVLLVESCRWLFDQATAAGQPMVINLSLGGHYGPHDGTDLESFSLSAMTGPGKIIVAAAGNEGSDFIHLGYDPQGSTGKTIFHVFSGFDVSSALFTVWHGATANLEFAVGVQTANELDETEFIAATGGYRTFDLQDGGRGLGRVYFQPGGSPDPGNGRMQLDIVVEPGEIAYQGNPDGYTWYLKVRGTGEFDAWSAAAGFLTPPARFSDSDDGGLIPGDNHKSLGSPALAPGVIAVASYATRSSWTDHQGNLQEHPETRPGDISFFSSHGPTTDPENTGHKPEIAAPGEFIVAAMSQSTGELSEGTKITEDEIDYMAMRGTSMACPHAAGIVALLLQVEPALDPEDIRRILQATGRSDEYTGADLPNFVWGYGKIDAYEAVARALGVGICAEDVECADGYSCSQEGRCKKIEEGCGCGGASSGSLLLIFLLLAWFIYRR
jgi:subtilisin family serine protease